MSDYLQVPTRTGLEGAKDKAATIYSLASWTAQTNRDFLNRVREAIKGYDLAESQVDHWFELCCNKTYSREYGDVFAHPNDTDDHGGDCDDATILLLAGILAMGIPACPDVILRNIDGKRNGVHVRVRVGFPPHSPPKDLAQWKIYDPSRASESRWIGSENLYNPKTTSVGYGNKSVTGNSVKLSGITPEDTSLSSKFSIGWDSALAIGLLAFSGFYIRARLNDKHHKIKNR